MWTQQSVDLFSGIVPKFIDPIVSDFKDLEKSPLYRYLDQFLKEERYLDNQGLALDDSDGDKKLVHIDELYVIPKLSKTRITAEYLAKIDGDDKATKSLPLNSVADLIVENPRMVLLGDPGVGKSTLIKWLVCSLCHWSDNYAKKRLGPLFPLLLTVRKLSQVNLSELSNEEFINLIFMQQGDALSTLILNDQSTKNCFFDLLSTGQVFFLIDGLDEISPEMTIWLAKQIKQLLREYPKTRLLMTSRIVGFNNQSFWYEKGRWSELEKASTPLKNSIQQFSKEMEVNISTDNELANDMEVSFSEALNLPTILYLAPFSPEQRKTFSENWVKKYLPPKMELRKEFIENITNISAQLIQINALSRIPVLLNLICFIQWRRGQLPHGRAELYQRIVGTYLESMDKARRLEHKLGREYDYQDIKNWLSKLAYFMHAGDLCLPDNKISSFDEAELEDARERLPNPNHNSSFFTVKESQLKLFLELQLSEIIDVDSLSEHSNNLVDYLQSRTGFLIPKGVENGENVFGFSHLSFQEYFCAYFISLNLDTLQDNKTGFQSLVNSTYEAAWKEIWVLVFEELSTQGKNRKEIGIFYDKVFDNVDSSGLRLFYEDRIFLLQKEFIDNTAIKLPVKKERSLELELLKAIYTKSRCQALAAILPVDEKIENESELVRLLKDEKKITIYFNRLKNFFWLQDLSSIETLTFRDFYSSDDFQGIIDINFKSLVSISFDGEFESIPYFKAYHDITDLSISSKKLKCLPDFKGFNKLKLLSLGNIQSSDLLNNIASKSLTSLSLTRTDLTGVKFGKNVENLETITILFANEIKNFNFISDLKNLESCDLLASKINRFRGIEKLKNLKNLTISHCDIDSGVDWDLLGELSELEELSFTIDGIEDISFLNKLNNLKLLLVKSEEKIGETQELILNDLKSKGVNVHR
ncbi:NACHT domain-containing protein [Pseudoalteromonas sp. EB27]|uniref:NACHT domain-containing protein n=1 Tax=Pseudoalteromonas sp. EB27 TaxID=1938368 RepID=UPI00097754B9|nr:NACHT domain-containing protein [Pseudoalteromonas sp. EB27]